MNLKDLLDRSLIENGKLVPNFEKHNLHQLISQVVEMMQSQADMKEVRINFDGMDIESDFYMLDVQRSMQVLINLISNATKFSHKHGEIYIDAIKAAGKENHTILQIQVVDQGIGMTEDQLKGIFTPFYKVDTDESRKFNANGNGLGLSICKNIAKCLNGDLTVSSEWGVGTIFTFKIEAENCGQIFFNESGQKK